MSHPYQGEPYVAVGNRLSVGDFNATPGTDAYKGVVVLPQAGELESNSVVDAAVDFTLKAYFLAEIGGGPPPILPAGFATEFHIYGIDGTYIGTYAGGPLVTPDEPDGANAPGGVSRRWYSTTSAIVTGGTLTAGETYRVTMEGSDGADWFAFHDGTPIYASAP